MLKCTKFNFGWVFALAPLGELNSAFSDLLARFKRSYFQGEWT